MGVDVLDHTTSRTLHFIPGSSFSLGTESRASKAAAPLGVQLDGGT